MKTLIFFATYNEAGNVAALIEQIAERAPAADIVVVDDNSPDGTADAIRKLGRNNVTVLVRKGKLGLGTAHLLAFCYAVANGYEALVTMDADGSHDPQHLPALMEKLDSGYDFVIGSRYMKGGACDYDGYRLRVSQAANVAARLLLSVKLTEFTTSYRIFKVEKLRSLDFGALLVGGYSFFLTTVVEAARRGWRLAEVPIHFRERGYGTSKIPPFEIFRGVANLMRLAVVKVFGGKPSWEAFSPQPCGVCGTGYSVVNAAQGRMCVFCGDGR
ncbi:polyprenol monophosphomannose synthase [Dyella halodurans]